MKRKICTLTALMLILALLLSGCGEKQEAAPLRFAEATSVDNLKKLDGKPVTIIGYMATLSPVSGKYMYLMNMPFQSCPFCVPNTTQLANTMAVYAPGGKTFDYTDQAIRVTGIMEIGDCTDDFGYVYNYRIKDAVYEIIDLGEISEEYALWQSIASDGIVGDLSAMFDYLYFVCCWPEYHVSYTDENGEEAGFFLYPGDAENYLDDNSPNGYKRFTDADYFPSLTRRVRAISDTGLTDLLKIIEDAQALEKDALNELSSGRYTYDETADRYALINGQKLVDRFDRIYAVFSGWLAGWEV